MGKREPYKGSRSKVESLVKKMIKDNIMYFQNILRPTKYVANSQSSVKTVNLFHLRSTRTAKRHRKH